MRTNEEIILLDEDFLASHKTGSKVICDPPVMNTDEDWIVLSKGTDFFGRLVALGWGDCRGTDDEETEELPIGICHRFDPYNDAGFLALRKGDLNIIVTEDIRFFSAFVEATELAKKLALNEKDQRVTLFDYVLKKSGV